MVNTALSKICQACMGLFALDAVCGTDFRRVHTLYSIYKTLFLWVNLSILFTVGLQQECFSCLGWFFFSFSDLQYGINPTSLNILKSCSKLILYHEPYPLVHRHYQNCSFFCGESEWAFSGTMCLEGIILFYHYARGPFLCLLTCHLKHLWLHCLLLSISQGLFFNHWW